MDTQTVRFLAGGLLVAICSFPSKAEITLDGSLGPAGGAISLGANNQFEIREELGRTVGSNLFHSFGTFNIGAGETAAFTGASPIENVLSRVTGGTASTIDGTLRTDFANATPNLFLLNPAGVVFGPNASLDVQGSFHVSTADYLRLEDGTRFTGIPSAVDQILTTAAPEAFGFLGDNLGNISIEQASLAVPNGESLSLIGGDMSIQGGELLAPAGRIDMASVRSPGEVIRTDTDLRLEGFAALGRIEMDQEAAVDTSGEGGGAIFVRGGELMLLGESDIKSQTLGDTPGQAIDIDLPNGALELRDGAAVFTTTRGAGRGSDIVIEARNVSIKDGLASLFTEIASDSRSTGEGGRIEIKAESLEVRNSAIISVSAFDAGNAGEILVEADNVVLAHNGADLPTGLFALAASSGDAGAIKIIADSLQVRDGALINSNSEGAGKGGSSIIEAGAIELTGEARILVGALSTGAAGELTIKADSLNVSDGGLIDLSTADLGKGGNLFIEAKDILLRGDKRRVITGIRGATLNSGDAGNLVIKAENLDIRDRAFVNTSTLGAGKGGNVFIEAGKILMTGDASMASVVDGSGDAGTFVIKANNFEVRDGSFIDTGTSRAGKGGDILIEAGDVLLSGNGDFSLTGVGSSTLSDSSANGGNITIDATNLHMRNGANIVSITGSDGNGGDIIVRAENVLLTRDGASLFTGMSTFSVKEESPGKAGSVTVTAKHFEMRGAMINASTSGTGDGGDIEVQADTVLLNGNGVGSIIVASAGPGSSGEAGKISITGNQSVRFLNGSFISVETTGSNGGDITVSADELIQLDDSVISTSVANGKGNGGNITIDPTFVVMDDSAIVANAAQGRGGNIDVVADFFFQSPDSIVDASSRAGIDGTVDIDSPDTNISGNIAILPETYINAADQLSERCGARTANRNSFIIKGRGSVPLAPGDLAPANVFDGKIGGKIPTSEPDRLTLTASRRSLSNDAMQPVSGCGK